MSWGGAREGAGRPASGPVPSEPHKTRPPLSPRHPVHVTARIARNARAGFRADLSPARGSSRPQLSRRQAYDVLRHALTLSLGRANFRIVHLALVRSRLELIVEADDKLALARGMQGFQVSAAKSLNRAARRRGTVFPDRYRMRILATRTDVRDAIGRLPLRRTDAWPQTWLLRIEGPTLHRGWIRGDGDG
jgi:hypothetical protein